MNETEQTEMLRTLFDALPSLVFVVDQDVRIQEYNAAAAELLQAGRKTVLKRRAGDIMHCLHAQEVPEGCGRGPACSDCIVRNSVEDAFGGNRVVRRRARMELVRDGQKLELYALISASPFAFHGSPLVLLVIEDISEITELHRIIPICAVCRKVRDDRESWRRIEAYFTDKWGVDFSHGLCPNCYEIERDRVWSLIRADQGTPEKTD